MMMMPKQVAYRAASTSRKYFLMEELALYEQWTEIERIKVSECDDDEGVL